MVRGLIGIRRMDAVSGVRKYASVYLICTVVMTEI